MDVLAVNYQTKLGLPLHFFVRNPASINDSLIDGCSVQSFEIISLDHLRKR